MNHNCKWYETNTHLLTCKHNIIINLFLSLVCASELKLYLIKLNSTLNLD